jgi:septal ring factor EnvC (AmiA/AmiB activator)
MFRVLPMQKSPLAADHGKDGSITARDARKCCQRELALHFAAMNRLAARFPPVIWLLLAATALAQGPDSDVTKVKEAELQEVREKISQLKKSMDRRAAERDKITASLQGAEVRISETRIYLADLERQRDFSVRKKAGLDAELLDREARLVAESDALAAQVRAVYTNGGQERVKLLLNQQDPTELGRLLVYYKYMSDYRGEQIEGVAENIAALTLLRAETADEENRISRLARTQAAELAELDETQQERQLLLASLNTQIEREGSAINRLAAEEQDLARLIAELTSILSDYPITSEEPFSTLRGRLTWPVAGRLIHDFGQPRASNTLKWNGVVFAAPRGREVRSVYHGRVVFADWLAGMGLLVIVDHGEGYMTLYGYNETILKSTGDWVAPGDVIATVGDSGGQAEAGLYFEIRKGTSPVSPRRWVSRSPSTK